MKTNTSHRAISEPDAPGCRKGSPRSKPFQMQSDVNLVKLNMGVTYGWAMFSTDVLNHAFITMMLKVSWQTKLSTSSGSLCLTTCWVSSHLTLYDPTNTGSSKLRVIAIFLCVMYLHIKVRRMIVSCSADRSISSCNRFTDLRQKSNHTNLSRSSVFKPASPNNGVHGQVERIMNALRGSALLLLLLLQS